MHTYKILNFKVIHDSKYVLKIKMQVKNFCNKFWCVTDSTYVRMYVVNHWSDWYTKAFCGKEKNSYGTCLKNSISLLPLNISDEFLGVYPYLQSQTATWTQVFKGSAVLTKIKQQPILRIITFCLYNISVPGRSYQRHPALL